MAIQIGATDTLISYGDILDAPGALSIAMWFRLDEANPGAAVAIVGKIDTGNTRGWLVRFTGSKALAFRTKNDADATEDDVATDLFTTSTWQHLGLSWDGSDVSFYINGALDSGGALAHATASGTTAALCQVGKNVNDAVDYSFAHLLVWDSAVGIDGIQAAMNGTIMDSNNLQLWVRAEETPSYNAITGLAGTAGGTAAVNLSEHTAHSGRGIPGFQPMMFDLGAQLNRQTVDLREDPHMGQAGDAQIYLEPGPFLNPLKHVLSGFGTEGMDAGVPGRGNTPSGLIGFRNEETVTTPGTSSETVTKLAPSTISTVWTKGYTAISTTWKKGRKSYE